ncbi:MAG TPA: DUF2846 domain-containing protein [Rickettsiales bacterium]|nr:DUF2846 domain-containing protein [Rickettsiales bacterium]
MKKYIYILISLCFLVSCASKHLGENFTKAEEPNENQVLIYFYRPQEAIGAIVYYTIKENNKHVVTMYNGGYYPYYTTEGTKTFSATTEFKKSITIDTKNGETYFVKEGIGIGVFIGHPKFTLVNDNTVALSEIEECRMLK